MRAKLVFAFLAGSLALSLLPACKKGSPTTPTPPSYGSKVGDTAADFSARDQNGQTVKLYQYYGKVILIDFSADWCVFCREEARHLENLFQDYKDQGFQILTVLTEGSPEAWAKQYNLTFPVLDDNSETLWKIYGEDAWPLNIVLDRKMVTRYKEAGYDEPAIISQIKKYL
jgi:peroxiredoxin